MTPSARMDSAIQILSAILETPKPSDQLMQDHFRGRKYIGSKDRKAIAETVYRTLRAFGCLDWLVRDAGMAVTARALLLLKLSRIDELLPQEIERYFDGMGYGAARLSEDEESLLRRAAYPKDAPEEMRLECPLWAYEGLKAQYPNTLADELRALQTEAPLDLRVNSLKGDRAAALKQLRSDGMEAVETPFAPFGIRVHGRPAFSMHPLYQSGAIEVQDEGSQILAQLCGVRPGEWVVDFCAGAGGKTMALAAAMQNKGRLWACDVEERRLENARKRFRRAGIHCVETKLLSDERDDWVKKHVAKADCVLIDAPCSGMGTWRRNPFARWQNLGPSLETLVPLQARILESAARLVKPGGRLIYATCSMLPQENAEQIERFLKAHAEFTPLPLKTMWTHPNLPLDDAMLQLTPYQHDTDGFFVAAMQRQ